MIWTVLSIQQASPELAAQLDRIATAQTITAAGMVILVVAVVLAGIAGFRLMRSVGRLLDDVDRTMLRLAPRAEPLLDRAARVAEEAGDISRSVRRGVEDVQQTLHDVNERLRSAADEAEERVRRFGAVLRVVQNEAEDLLLDSAAAARGVQATTERLRGGDGRGRGGRRRPRQRAGTDRGAERRAEVTPEDE